MSAVDARVRATWARALGVDPALLAVPGTLVIADPRRTARDVIQLWPAGQRTVVEVAPSRRAAVEAVARRRPAEHRMSADDLLLGLPLRVQPEDRARLLVLDPECFDPLPVPAGTEVRELTEADRGAVAAFLRRCPPAEQQEGDVGVGAEHERSVGAVQDGRVVAVASVVDWRGFADLGVVADPQARGRGVGGAAISRLCELLLEDPRVVLYRHREVNVPSAIIAARLGLHPIGAGEGVRPVVAPRPRPGSG